MIRIQSKKDGFRRCGMAHPKGPVDYPEDRFTAEELAILKAEPMLTVTVEAERDIKTSNDTVLEAFRLGLAGKTVEELKASLTAAGIAVPSGAKKADLVELLVKDTLEKP